MSECVAVTHAELLHTGIGQMPVMAIGSGVEVCINSDGPQAVSAAVEAAYCGDAATIEFCAGMQLGGLTPNREQIIVARSAFTDRAGLMVMVRPRGGDFCYSDADLQQMEAQIVMAAQAGSYFVHGP